METASAGGRPRGGSLLMGAGLAAVGSSTGRIFGASARRAVANLTLFGGFASTVCRPLSALAVESGGRRA